VPTQTFLISSDVFAETMEGAEFDATRAHPSERKARRS